MPNNRALFAAGRRDSGLSNSIQFNDDFLDRMETEEMRIKPSNNANLSRSINVRSIDFAGLGRGGHSSVMGGKISPLRGRFKDKKVINSNLLTSVPKRGRMIDTQKYIRDNLQAYADNKYFAFTKQVPDKTIRE